MFIRICVSVIVFSRALSLSFFGGVDQTFRRGVNCASTQKDETLLSKAQTVAILRRRRRRRQRRKTKTF